MKKYTTWLKVAAIFQVLTAAFHSISLFVTPIPTNDTEKQLLDLMSTYMMDMGSGFHRSMGDLMTGLSSCFSLVYLLGGLLNWYLVSKKLAPDIFRGVIIINLVIFGIAFGLMVTFTFLPPIILTGLVFTFLLFSWVSIRSRAQKAMSQPKDEHPLADIE